MGYLAKLVKGCQSHGRARSAQWLLVGLVCALLFTGCTRRFYRKWADKDVNVLLKRKDKFEAWRVENYHVYPDPRARFADPTNPDRPPMPPDDPAAKELSCNPQKPPKKAGIALVSGDQWLEILKGFDAENRLLRAMQPDQQSRPLDWQPGPGNTPPTKQEVKTESTEPKTEKPGFLINMVQASDLGLINSRDYQTRRENLYLFALPITLERFAFLPQFFGLGEVIRGYSSKDTPEGQQNRWNMAGETGLTQFFPTGLLFLFRLANVTVIQMSGDFVPHTTSESTLVFDAMQPFLRGGGLAVNLEPLTQAQRDFVYEIRRYARFRKEYFVALAGGGNIAGGADVRRGFESVNLTVGIFTPSEGYLPTLLRQGQLANERQNVAALESILKLFDAFKEGGDISQLQVDQVEQQLLQSRSTVLQREQDYRDSLDRFKLFLGMPPDVPLELEETPLRELTRQLQRFAEIIAQFEAARTEALRYDDPAEADMLRARLRTIVTSSAIGAGTRFRTQFPPRWAGWEELPREHLRGGSLPLQLGGVATAIGVGPLPALPWFYARADVPTVRERLNDLLEERRKLLDLEADLETQGQTLSSGDRAWLRQLDAQIDLGRFERLLREYESRPWKDLPDKERRQRQQAALFRDLINQFVLVLGEARSQRVEELRKNWPELSPTIVKDVDVVTSDLDAALDAVGQTALTYRLDLMNQRGLLVDAWRQIAVAANALMGVFNVRYHLESLTPIGEAQPLNFDGSRNRHQMFLSGELPLVRMSERNVYRATLIAFQRQRRDLMRAEDQVMADVRAELRQLRVLAENYKIQQRAVELAYFQVENSLDTFQSPPTPAAAGGGGNTAGNAAALTQQLLNAQRSLPQAQNQLLSTWINYQITRLQLYRDLELMPLDHRGVWIDELSKQQRAEKRSPDADRPAQSSEELPAPRPVPAAEGVSLGRPY